MMSAGDANFWEMLARSMMFDQEGMNPAIVEEVMETLETESNVMDLEARIAELSLELAAAKRGAVESMLSSEAAARSTTALAAAEGGAAAQKTSTLDATVTSMSLSELVQSLRQLGNDSFKRGDYSNANALYSAAIDAARGDRSPAEPTRVATPYGAGTVLSQRDAAEGGAVVTQLDWTLADGTRVMAYLQPDSARHDTLIVDSPAAEDASSSSSSSASSASASASIAAVTAAQIEARGIRVGDFVATLANRSAARLKMEPPRSVAALLDATAAARLDPGYAKAYHRMAAALLALRPAKLFSAREAYELALQRRPADRFFAKQLRSTTERLHAEAWRGPAPGVRPRAAGCLIESVAHMELVFKNIDHQHVRLAALGLFWNRARPHERLLLFKRFMTELSDTPVALQLSAQMMCALPLVPMQIALIPPEWLLFYEPLHLKAKVTLCMHLWRLCSSFEQAAIIKDLRALFGQ